VKFWRSNKIGSWFFMKGILIGNGFSSQLIEDYCNKNMMKKLRRLIPKKCDEIEELFNKFRIITEDKTEEENHVKKELKKTFPINWKDKYDKYFIGYGLIDEVRSKEIQNVENYLKVASLFDLKDKEKITKAANKIYYNSGKNDLKAVQGLNIKKARDFFDEFKHIFTTNYDLILDDIIEEKEIYHLHGSFKIKKVSEPGKIYYVKTKNKLSYEEAHLTWGTEGEVKIKRNEAGMNFNNFTFPMEIPGSILLMYLSKLSSLEINELHMLGYSGKNDNHINKEIQDNKNIKKIVYYCNPSSELKSVKFFKTINKRLENKKN
jgi:hypothetical protein